MSKLDHVKVGDILSTEQFVGPPKLWTVLKVGTVHVTAKSQRGNIRQFLVRTGGMRGSTSMNGCYANLATQSDLDIVNRYAAIQTIRSFAATKLMSIPTPILQRVARFVEKLSSKYD